MVTATVPAISLISLESPTNMLEALEGALLGEILREGVGRISSVNFSVDSNRGRAVVDLIGDVCEGEIALRIFYGSHGVQESINSWIAEERIQEFKTEIARTDGRMYILVVGRKA